MLSKRKIKVFKSLQVKKYRQQEAMFMVEGAKGIEEVLQSGFEVVNLLLTEPFKDELSAKKISLKGEVDMATEKEIVSVGTFGSNNAGIAIVKIPTFQKPTNLKGLTLALDNVRDPGNLGTIIRIADWYGVKQIVCSKETADLYNPKVINATMGSFTRVNLFYTDLKSFLEEVDQPVYGALLNGEPIYKAKLKTDAIILMGNESKGISDNLLPLVSNPIKIPGRGGAESLNVGVATAVVLDNFFR